MSTDSGGGGHGQSRGGHDWDFCGQHGEHLVPVRSLFDIGVDPKACVVLRAFQRIQNKIPATSKSRGPFLALGPSAVDSCLEGAPQDVPEPCLALHHRFRPTPLPAPRRPPPHQGPNSGAWGRGCPRDTGFWSVSPGGSDKAPLRGKRMGALGVSELRALAGLARHGSLPKEAPAGWLCGCM